ncbi:MAG: response regulator [Acidobacteria bacterium]|nr:response regulator [Acidobacteriota bacterium]
MSARAPLVLVVEDDPSVLGLIALLMESAGYEVLTARDGLEGLVRLELRRPALMILDIMMPYVEGGRVLEEIRADARLSGVPVIVVSGRHDVHEAFDPLVGAENVFAKPFRPEDLVRRAAALLAPKGGTP